MTLQDLYNNYESSGSFFESKTEKSEEVAKSPVPPKVVEKEKPVEKVVPKEKVVQKEEFDEDLIEKLFIESETKQEFREKWIETYKKWSKSKKDNYISKKIRAGRFRIDPTQKRGIAFLPDLKTKDMNAKQLLNTQWLRRV